MRFTVPAAFRILAAIGLTAAFAAAQETTPQEPARDAQPVQTAQLTSVTVTPGTRIPLSLINSVSTKHSVEGDRVYLQTVFPVTVDGKVVIPPGSYVLGTVTQLRRPGRVKGKGEMFLRFDSLTLPNGVARDFRARVSTVDPRGDEKVDRAEGKIKGDGDRAGDVRTVGEGTLAGATTGAIIGAVKGSPGLGLGAGAAAGAVGGLIGVLLTRGPDPTLAQGTTIEMVLDRPLVFASNELNFGPLQPVHVPDVAGPADRRSSSLSRPRVPF